MPDSRKFAQSDICHEFAILLLRTSGTSWGHLVEKKFAFKPWLPGTAYKPEIIKHAENIPKKYSAKTWYIHAGLHVHEALATLEFKFQRSIPLKRKQQHAEIVTSSPRLRQRSNLSWWILVRSCSCASSTRRNASCWHSSWATKGCMDSLPGAGHCADSCHIHCPWISGDCTLCSKKLAMSWTILEPEQIFYFRVHLSPKHGLSHIFHHVGARNLQDRRLHVCPSPSAKIVFPSLPVTNPSLRKEHQDSKRRKLASASAVRSSSRSGKVTWIAIDFGSFYSEFFSYWSCNVWRPLSIMYLVCSY